MKHLVLLSLILLLNTTLSVAKKDTVFVYSNLERVLPDAPKASSSYYTVSVKSDQPFTNLVVFNDKQHRKYAEVNYSQSGKKQGLATYYYPGGGKEEEYTYVNGDRLGAYNKCYMNGQLKEVGEIKIRQSDMAAEPLLYQYWDSLGTQLIAAGKGELQYLYKNGELKEKGAFDAGRKVGAWVGYYEDGSLYFEEDYQAGNLVKGKSYKDGKEFHYTVLEEDAIPVDGYNGFYNFIAQNLEYPKKAFKSKKQGVSYVRFVINEQGDVVHTEILEGRALGYGLDEEAQRVIALTKWQPGKLRGIVTKQRKILPMKFKLAN